MRMRSGERILRSLFDVERSPGLGGREVGYAALAAIAPLVRKHASEIVFEVDDSELVMDLTQRRELPVPLMLPYVRARCALNSFASYTFTLEAATQNDLEARALAEVSLHVAA